MKPSTIDRAPQLDIIESRKKRRVDKLTGIE